jgi:prepilin signal peptidase PulO-like enzyme (type II secretory pathway)
LVILLILMILIGSFWKGDLPKGLTYPLLVIAVIAVAVAVLYFTDLWQSFLDLIYSQGATGPSIFANAIFVIIMAAAIVAVIIGAGKAKKD